MREVAYETHSELFIFSVKYNRAKINKIKAWLYYIFILLLFSEKIVCIYVSNALKWNIFRNEAQQIKYEVSMVLFILFQILLLVIFHPFFLFLTQMITSFQCFAQIKCNFLPVKDHSFVQSFTVSEIDINLPY